MSPNSDNAMARFLFAILKQKNLKDIDWNQVASDPVLIEPITNGHAARMRYSRFRATVSGQPAKRNRTTEKSRSSKVKKEDQGKKGSSSEKDRFIKSESGTSLSSYAQFSPASTTSPYMGDIHDFNTRFLTPCSDDMPQSLSIHPAALEELRRPSGAMFPPLDGTSDFLNHAGHDHISAAHSPTFSAFDVAYDLSNYSSTEVHSQDTSNSAGSQAVGDWSDRFPDHHF